MSHSLSKVNVGNNALAVVKVINYTQGGEQFTLAELGLTGSVTDIIFIVDPSSTILPQYIGSGTVKLNSCLALEVPTTTNLNFVFAAIVQGTN